MKKAFLSIDVLDGDIVFIATCANMNYPGIITLSGYLSGNRVLFDSGTRTEGIGNNNLVCLSDEVMISLSN